MLDTVIYIKMMNALIMLFCIVTGVIKFKKDIEMMLGRRLMTKIAFFFFIPAWVLITPLALMVSIITVEHGFCEF